MVVKDIEYLPLYLKILQPSISPYCHVEQPSFLWTKSNPGPAPRHLVDRVRSDGVEQPDSLKFYNSATKRLFDACAHTAITTS